MVGLPARMPALSFQIDCLPIASRELRVAAGKRSTVWLRVAAALTGLVIGGWCLIVNSLQGTSAAQMGGVLFHALTWMGLAAGLSAGLFLTSDCLSEEKREGTLGLLFLTELRGYDVAVGKLLATSLRGSYALLAVFPMLALTQLMGGVTAAQYWGSCLALLNALFCSLTAGLLVSALSRDSQKALAATFGLLLLLALGGPLADVLIAKGSQRGFQPFWCLSSPAYALVAASGWGGPLFWRVLAITQAVGWGMLGLTCVLVPRTWQERRKAGAEDSQGRAYAWRYGGARRRETLRRKLLERQPLAWLVCREYWQSRVLWAAALLVAGGFATVWLLKDPSGVWLFWNYCGGAFALVLYLGMASQSCRFFVEARRSGLLELLLASPVSERQIVAGQWQALLRRFGWPLLLLLSLHVAGVTLGQLSMQRLMTQVRTATSAAVTNQSGTVSSTTVTVGWTGQVSSIATTNGAVAPPAVQQPSTAERLIVVSVSAAATALCTAANLVALVWFGMWMGLTSRSPNLATLKTIVFVQVLPWFVITLATTMGLGVLMAGAFFRAGTTQPTTWLFWWPLFSMALSAVLALVKDAGFIVWSRNKLRSSLRQQVTQGFGHSRTGRPAPAPPPPTKQLSPR